MIRVPCLVLAVAVLLVNPAATPGHTLAGTMISVAVTRPGTLTITIEAEADPLTTKLEALAGTATGDPPMTSAERRARITSLFPTLRANIDARIAQRPVALELQDVAVDDTAQTEIRLTGRVPPGQPIFTWRSTFIFGAYRVTIRRGTGEVIEWLQGPQTSTPITLEPPDGEAEAPALGRASNRIGFSLAMGALVVYVLCRRRTAQRLVGG